MGAFYFKCPICGNDNPSKIGFKNGLPYCRACVLFKGNKVEETISHRKRAPIYLSYHLSNEQNDLSDKLISNFKKKKNSLVHAVCGSGKTEIVLGIIQYCIENNLRVGFALPRRDVAIELHARFKAIFKNNYCCLAYGGHHEKLVGDLIVLTTHQLFRYEKYFDLLIMDEVDAFPFKDNDILNKFFFRSIKGNYILMSATPSEKLIDNFKKIDGKILYLNKRFHGYPLPIPVIKKGNKVTQYFILYRLINSFIKENKPIFIFAPTIALCNHYFKVINLIIKGGDCVHSKKENREDIINKFKENKLKFLFTTAVLERGVTVANLQVIVIQSDHNIYDSYSLIQIAGRAGRKKDFPDGEVIFIAKKETKEMEKAIREIKRANENL